MIRCNCGQDPGESWSSDGHSSTCPRGMEIQIDRLQAQLTAANAREKALEGAAMAVVEEKERLSTYLGGPVSIDELNRRIKTLAALLEQEEV
jgi:hypothetical protein